MRTQNPPPLKACRFDSDLGHHSNSRKSLRWPSFTGANSLDAADFKSVGYGICSAKSSNPLTQSLHTNSAPYVFSTRPPAQSNPNWTSLDSGIDEPIIQIGRDPNPKWTSATTA